MQKTPIGWTDYSSNLLKYRDQNGNIVHACVRISEGCRNCYACALAGRFGREGKDFTAENMKALTPFFDAKEASQILNSMKISGKKVFIDDMTDLFGDWVPEHIIDQHFAIFAMRPDVTFQILTKRADRMRDYLNRDIEDRLDDICHELPGSLDETWHYPAEWPLHHVHPGVSIEDQPNADKRLRALLETRAAVRWASVEPLVAPVNLNPYLNTKFMDSGCYAATERLDGIVIGGESGAGHREMPLQSAINLARDANRVGVAVYFKQDSGPRPGMQGRIPDDVWAMKEWPKAA